MGTDSQWSVPINMNKGQRLQAAVLFYIDYVCLTDPANTNTSKCDLSRENRWHIREDFRGIGALHHTYPVLTV